MTEYEEPAGALAGRAIIVTGGASGIGRAAAEHAAEVGASVMLADRDGNVLARATRELEATGARVVSCTIDATAEADVQKMVDATVTIFGRVDGLVTSAGITFPCPALEMTSQQFDDVLRVNLTGTFLCASAVARHMVATGTRGSIVTISSTLAFSGRPNLSQYVASKGGVVALTKNLALEWGQYGIRVNSVAPGLVETPIIADFTDEYRAEYARHTPLGRIGFPEDVAKVVRFLLTDESGYVTGQTIAVNGGFSMPS